MRDDGRNGGRSRVAPVRRRTAAVALFVAAGVAGLALAACGDATGPAASAPVGVRTFEGLSKNHVEQPVDYDRQPPVGGDHAATWQDCGVYDSPIVTEFGVHSMEHGAVWVTYRRDAPGPERKALQELVAGQPYVLLSPWAGALPAPVVASAWGRQLQVDSAADPQLAAFIEAFRQGPQTPEPGAPCTGGQGPRTPVVAALPPGGDRP